MGTPWPHFYASGLLLCLDSQEIVVSKTFYWCWESKTTPLKTKVSDSTHRAGGARSRGFRKSKAAAAEGNAGQWTGEQLGQKQPGLTMKEQQLQSEQRDECDVHHKISFLITQNGLEHKQTNVMKQRTKDLGTCILSSPCSSTREVLLQKLWRTWKQRNHTFFMQ